MYIIYLIIVNITTICRLLNTVQNEHEFKDDVKLKLAKNTSSYFVRILINYIDDNQNNNKFQFEEETNDSGKLNFSVILDYQYVVIVSRQHVKIFLLNGELIRSIQHNITEFRIYSTVQLPNMKGIIVKGKKQLNLIKLDLYQQYKKVEFNCIILYNKFHLFYLLILSLKMQVQSQFFNQGNYKSKTHFFIFYDF